MTRVRNNAFRESRETVIEEAELGKALDQANAIDNEYFRLRALAVLFLLRLSGKRRTEIAWIPLENFKVENDLLTVTFTLEKKKRKSKKCPGCTTKNSKGSMFCKKCGLDLSTVQITFTSKQSKALKALPISDPLNPEHHKIFELPAILDQYLSFGCHLARIFSDTTLLFRTTILVTEQSST